MKIRIHTMMGTNHSWAFVIQSLARAITNINNHEVYIKSTNGLQYFPEDLKKLLLPGYHSPLLHEPADYLTQNGEFIKVDPKSPLPEIKDPNNGNYDLELAYTIFYQFCRRFFNQSRCRAAIWNYEFSILPPGWEYYAKSIDYILPSSKFSYDIFANNNVPKEKMVIVPHGVDTNIFNPNIQPFKLKTEKKVKFLHNAIPHHRKLHDRVIKGYLDAFNGNDDVCLVLKTKIKSPDANKPFEVNVGEILEKELKNKKNPAEIEVVNTFVENIGSLYTACDAIVSMSATEGFSLTLLEALACDKIVIAPRQGGCLDFLDDNNSLLINTGEMSSPLEMQYWTPDKRAVVGDPDINHFSELLRKVYGNLEKEKKRILEPAKKTVEKFSWENAAKIILDLPIPKISKKFYNKKKILYIIPYKMCGGAEVWVREAIRNLDKNKYEPHIAFVNGINEELKELFKNIENIENLEKSKDKGLKCLMESGGYSIIHFYNSFMVYHTIKEAWDQGLRCRIVETAHSELSWNDSMAKVSKREPFVLAICSVSNILSKKLVAKGNKNVVTLPQHINWNKFFKPRSKNILENIGIKTDFVVGFVGRLSKEKNINIILECAKQLQNISFVIVGDGPQKDVLEKFASKNVYFVGHREDVENFYGAFDILILPSMIEGMPLVILESMASGTPVIASNVGAVSEIVSDGVSGVLIWNPNSIPLFIQGIKKLQDKNFWNSCSNNCNVIVKSLYEKSKNVNINIFYNLLFEGGR